MAHGKSSGEQAYGGPRNKDPFPVHPGALAPDSIGKLTSGRTVLITEAVAWLGIGRSSKEGCNCAVERTK